MFKLSNLPIKQQLFIVPILAVFVFLITIIVQNYSINNYTKEINTHLGAEISYITKLNHFESDLSKHFGDVHSLIVSVIDMKDAEELVYLKGKPLIYELHSKKRLLDAKVLPLFEHVLDEETISDIKKEFEIYSQETMAAITIVTVDLKLARNRANIAAVHYNKLIQNFDSAKKTLILHLQEDIERITKKSEQSTLKINIALVIIMLVIIYIAFLFSKDISNKISKVLVSINKIAKAQKNVDIPEFENNHELQKITDGLKIFQHNIQELEKLHKEAIESQKQLLRSEKLASLGDMIGNIAHQWRQPLSVISTASTGVLFHQEMGSLNEKIIEKEMNYINDNAQYLSQTIDDFKNFIKGNQEKKQFVLSDTIDSSLSLLHASLKSHDIEVFTSYESTIELVSYENELKQCLINIVNNSKDAFIDKDVKRRYVFINLEKNNQTCKISIKDNAGGIPDKIIGRIFEPYFTTKHKSKGTGIGLHMSHQIITESMNGKIHVSNETYTYNDETYTGANFIIELPCK